MRLNLKSELLPSVFATALDILFSLFCADHVVCVQ